MTHKEMISAIEFLNAEDKKAFWDLLEKEYSALKKKIISKNSKNFNFISKKIYQSIEKEYFKDVISKSKNLGDNFPDFRKHVSNLIQDNTDIDKNSPFSFYLDSSKNSPFASIAKQEVNKILLIFNRNAIILFRKDIERFDAIFLHEAAHIAQNDTNYLFKKKHFLSEKFIKRGVLNYLKSVLPILIVLLGFFIWIYISFDVDTLLNKRLRNSILDTILTSQLSGKLLFFLFIALVGIIRYRINIRKNNRLLSEFGADMFSLVKAKNLKLIEILESTKNQEIDSKLHYPVSTRINMLLDILTKNYRILKNN